MSAPRKVVQLAACERVGTTERVYALCDDGTLWVADDLARYSLPSVWRQLPPPPAEVPS